MLCKFTLEVKKLKLTEKILKQKKLYVDLFFFLFYAFVEINCNLMKITKNSLFICIHYGTIVLTMQSAFEHVEEELVVVVVTCVVTLTTADVVILSSSADVVFASFSVDRMPKYTTLPTSTRMMTTTRHIPIIFKYVLFPCVLNQFLVKSWCRFICSIFFLLISTEKKTRFRRSSHIVM